MQSTIIFIQWVTFIIVFNIIYTLHTIHSRTNRWFDDAKLSVLQAYSLTLSSVIDGGCIQNNMANGYID